MIKLEKWFDNTTTEGLRVLLDAAGRCPPEDVGGAPGYNSSIPTSSTGGRSKPPSTHCRKYPRRRTTRSK
ncbi:IS1096 element passenger TnpR family protein [Bradyrhizobium sp. USDA 4516]